MANLQLALRRLARPRASGGPAACASTGRVAPATRGRAMRVQFLTPAHTLERWPRGVHDERKISLRRTRTVWPLVPSEPARPAGRTGHPAPLNLQFALADLQWQICNSPCDGWPDCVRRVARPRAPAPAGSRQRQEAAPCGFNY